MAILHLLSRPSSASNGLSQAADFAQPGDGVLLLRDSVYAAMAGSVAATRLAEAQSRGVLVYCLAPDLKARGIAHEQLFPGIAAIDYDGFVELSIRFPRNYSW